MPLSILLVEDNPDDADILRELLAESGGERVSISVVETLKEALVRLSRATADLVLLDLSLPDSQGLETVTRAVAGVPGVPIVVLTGADDDVLGVAAIHAGAQDYLAKGAVDGALLRRTIRYAIERHRLLAQRSADALVSAALVQVGESLMASLRTRSLLERLCHVTAEVLGCSITSTWVLDPESGCYRPAAANTPVEWARIQGLQVPADALAPLTTAGEGEEVRRLDRALRAQLPVELVRLPAGTTAEACLLLRRSGEIAGMQVCGYGRANREWSEVRERIARGLVHAASLALDNAQLVAELEQSNAIKTYFAGTMSHELRGTVFAIGGLSGMLIDALHRGPLAEAENLAQRIGVRARESLGLIRAALEVTRSEVRPVESDDSELSVAELLEPLQQETELLSNGHGVAVEWHVAADLPALQTDTVKLRMALKNLIGNALKFTDSGKVRVSAERVGERVRLTVSDTGIGIPAEELPHLFEPFHQAHGTVSRNAGGAGLGLYIVRRLVDLIRGTIAVDSTPGRGTTFAIDLPPATRSA